MTQYPVVSGNATDNRTGGKSRQDRSEDRMAENMDSAPKPKHRATYARDKRKGGYLVRVQGPYSDRFAGREVPVTLKNGSQQMETLDRLIWSGKDTETGEAVTLYSFIAKPKENVEVEF